MRFPGWERNGPRGACDDPAPAGKAERIGDRGVALLAITRDPDLYEKLREIASGWKWTICQTAEVDPGATGSYFASASIQIVIYDGDSIDGDWKEALAKIGLWERNPCILLASRVADRYLWDEVIRCGGYDIMAKTAEQGQIMRTLRFAWFRKKTLQSQWTEGQRPEPSHR